MKREFLKDLGLEGETIDKIMAEYGKDVNSNQVELDKVNSKLEKSNADLQTYKDKVVELEKVSNDSSKVKEELENLKKSIAEREEQEKVQQKEEMLTKNINEAIADKKFINDYTKNAIINEIKTSLGKEENAGKSIKDLFEGITKDQTGIFVNPNSTIDMPGMGDGEQENNPKEIPLVW